MKNKLLYIAVSIILSLSFVACGDTEISEESSVSIADTDTFLARTQDMGQSYIDSFIFIGESTTYHLKNRAVLSGGKNTTQVWGPKSGTVNLDTTVGSLKIVYPETDEELGYNIRSEIGCQAFFL